MMDSTSLVILILAHTVIERKNTIEIPIRKSRLTAMREMAS